jgi:hypothetical protein
MRNILKLRKICCSLKLAVAYVDCTGALAFKFDINFAQLGSGRHSNPINHFATCFEKSQSNVTWNASKSCALNLRFVIYTI